MAQHALDVLTRLEEQEELPSQALYLRGEALRELGYFHEAIEPLTEAAEEAPSNIHVWLALGWCHKRTGRIDLAIEALEEALTVDPDQALVHYNLACYWSLAGNKRQAILFLAQALDLSPDYRDLVAAEADFDPIRNDPGFQSLISVIV
jgi:tetratricopeptide (TPR) repeat protein